MFRKRRKPLLTAQAEVPTATPERYAKQLISHLGQKVAVSESPEGAVLQIGSGRGIVTTGDSALLLTAEAPDTRSLADVQDVLARHLARFGSRDELTVSWSAARAKE